MEVTSSLDSRVWVCGDRTPWYNAFDYEGWLRTLLLFAHATRDGRRVLFAFQGPQASAARASVAGLLSESEGLMRSWSSLPESERGLAKIQLWTRANRGLESWDRARGHGVRHGDTLQEELDLLTGQRRPPNLDGYEAALLKIETRNPRA